MKITVVGDVHWSESSSIISSKIIQNDNYTDRIKRLIETINWCEQIDSDMIIYLGDFFDKVTLTDMEITALKEIKWNTNIPHYLVLGNHEWSKNGKRNNSANALTPYNFKVVDSYQKILVDDAELCLYPYVKEEFRETLNSMFGNKEKQTRIVFSHNDVKGIRYGAVVSTSGVDVNEIENECDLFLNGHLHNGSQFCRNGFNVGNICGQNFLEDATKYKHEIFILDTTTRSIESYENPFAYNFYKIEINEEDDIKELLNLKKHSVVSIKCNECFLELCKDVIKNESNVGKIDYSRIIVVRDGKVSSITNSDTYINLNINHLDKLVEFIHSNFGVSDIIDEELNEVLK